jgi:polyisoprenoid-binding protein YceI
MWPNSRRKAAQVSFPVATSMQGNRRTFDGVIPIRRLAFNIGEGEWKDPSIVADDVTIKFHLVTVK